MSRAGTGDVVFVKPRNNIFTALAAGGTVALIVGVLALYLRCVALGVKFF